MRVVREMGENKTIRLRKQGSSRGMGKHRERVPAEAIGKEKLTRRRQRPRRAGLSLYNRVRVGETRREKRRKKAENGKEPVTVRMSPRRQKLGACP